MGREGEAGWTYYNPVRVQFGCGEFSVLGAALAGKRWAACTYDEPYFTGLVDQLAALGGEPVLRISDIAPNPDMVELTAQCARFAQAATPEVIVAIGGGSVIDSAKVFAAARGDFAPVKQFLTTGDETGLDRSIALIAVPTTAGTGSEVTCWATVWDRAGNKKYSLSREDLYPESAVIDPELMRGKSHELTVSTGLDALSHALESIWNLHANPVSANYAVKAARDVIDVLPALVKDLDNIALRERMAYAATCAGLAFSNTRTALAHNLSYPVTLKFGVPHGIACSFTLPAVLMSVADIDGFRGDALREVFGDDLTAAAHDLKSLLASLDVPTHAGDYGIDEATWQQIVDDAFVGQRGKNFSGNPQSFASASEALGL